MANQLLSDRNDLKSFTNHRRYAGTRIIDNISNGFFTVDHRWTVTYWNKAAEKILNVPAKDIVGRNLWYEFAAILPVDFYLLYHKAFLLDTPIHFEEYWGEMGAWFEVIAYHCEDKLSVSFKSSRQHTKPQDIHNKLLARNDLYKLATEVTNDCLWEWDIQAREIFWIDGGHKRVFGYPIENALIPQRFWENCIHPDDQKRVLSKLQNLLAGGSESFWADEYRFKKVNGDYANVWGRGHIIYDDQNIATCIIGATQDISSRWKVELERLVCENKLSLIAKQTTNAVIITGLDEKITWVNSAFTKITGYSQEEVIGRKPGSFLQGEDTDPQTVQYLRQKVMRRDSFRCDILNYSKSGEKYWVHLQGQLIQNENGNFEDYFCIETDITEKVLIEEKAKAEWKQQQKEIIAAVITAQEGERADISKELNDNLNQVLVATKIYIELAIKQEDNRDLFLRKSSGYINNVIKDIRKITNTLTKPGIFIGLLDSIHNLIHDISQNYPIQIQFQVNGFEILALDIKVQQDLYRIVQEQINNIINHAEATAAKIQLIKNKGQIALYIKDNGVGWHQSWDKSQAGFINIKSRAELHGGHLTIISEPGEGYALEVIIPWEKVQG